MEQAQTWQGARAGGGSLAGLLRRAETYAALAIAVLALRVAHLAGHDLLLDDSFISFRYARNLARGLGLVFNPGERVEGYTNFLWTVLLAAGDRIGLDIPILSVVLAFLATAGTIALLVPLGRRLFAGLPGEPLLVAAPPLVFAAMGSQARYVVSGMETSLFVFLVTLGTYLYLARARPFVVGLGFAAAAMTRPEGVFYCGLVVAFHLVAGEPAGWRRWRDRLPAALWIVAGLLALYAPYFWWRWDYYGYLLPNTYYAKAGGLNQDMVTRGWKYLLYTVRQASFELPLALALCALPAVRRDRSWLLALGAVAATLLYFVLVGGDFVFFFGPRLLLPVLPLLLLLAVEGAGGLSRLLAGRAPAVRVGLTAALLAALLVNAVWWSWPARFDRMAYVQQLHRGWTELGKWLAANTPPDATVATGAVGLTPYYSDRYTIDMLGLTDTYVAHLPIPLGKGVPGHEKWDMDYVFEREPDYLYFVLLDSEWEKLEETLAESYDMIALVKAGPQPGPWVLEASEVTPELMEQGYAGGLYRRREGS